MPSHAVRVLIQAARAASPPATDAELLARFASTRDEAAFAELVRRHARLVAGAARRVAGDPAAADDAAQAAFLLLARKAGAGGWGPTVGPWLYAVAIRLARKAKSRAARRPAPLPADASADSNPDPAAGLLWAEVRAALDDALARLPAALRDPLVLCYLQGMTRDEAAAALGCSPVALKGRLARGRARLRAILGGRGLTLPAALAGVLAADTAAPAVSAAAVARLATAYAVSGTAPAPVLALLHGAAGGWKAAALAGLLTACASGVVALAAADPQPAEPPKGVVAQPTDNPDRLPDGAVIRLGYSPLRVGNSAFALTPDEKQIVTVSPEGIARRFDAATGRLLERKQLAARDDVWPAGQAHARMSADGTTATIMEYIGKSVRHSVWDVSTGRMLFQRSQPRNAYDSTFALSPDGKVLVAWESLPKHKAILRVYDTATGRKSDLGEIEFNANRLYFSADGKHLAVYHSEGSREDRRFFSCFDVPARKLEWSLPAPEVARYAFSPDGRTVAYAAFGTGGLKIIEPVPETGRPVERSQECPRAHPNMEVAFAPDSRTLVIDSFDSLVLWDVRVGRQITAIPKPQVSGGYGPKLGAFSADGKTLVTNYTTLQRWDLTAGMPMFSTDSGGGLSGPVEHLAFTPDAKEVFASGWGHDSARWDAATGKRVAAARKRFGYHLVATPAGLRSVGHDHYDSPNTITAYDPVAGTEVGTISWAGEKDLESQRVLTYALAGDGRTLLSAHWDNPGSGRNVTVIVSDLPTGRRMGRFTSAGGTPIRIPKFSPCGRWVVHDGKVYHALTGSELFAPAGDTGERLAGWPVGFSADGRLLATKSSAGRDGEAASDAIAVWELASGKVLVRLPGSAQAAQVAFAPDNRTVALADARGVRLHDAATGRRLCEFPAPNVTCEIVDAGDGPQTVAFSPDGRTLATGHRDGTVTLWAVPQLPSVGSGAWWADLASENAAAARAAVDRAARDPAAVKVLATEFRPPPDAPDPTTAALIADLDADRFAAREGATAKLRALGAAAEPALRRALGAASPEARKRIEALLEAAPPAPLTLPVAGETLRGVRAIEVLARANAPQARNLLAGWADQTTDPRLAAEARSVLARLAPLGTDSGKK